MKIKKLRNLPHEIRRFIRMSSELASKLNMDIYLVGGIVRDLFLDRKNVDYDIVVEGDGIEFAKRISKNLNISFQRHHAFGTATIYFGDFKIDIATCRKEHYSHWGALPVVKPASLREDLYRRDFTFNSMAISLNKNSYGQLIDFYDGYLDLEKGLIRVLYDNSFLDDPTRILRAIRFQMRFSFNMERHTLNLLKKAASINALKFIDEQRLRDELILILKEKHPLKYIKRIQYLLSFSFIDEDVRLNRNDYKLFLRIDRAIRFYKDNFITYRKLDYWLIYLMGIINKLSKEKITNFCRNFGFRKGEQKRLINLAEQKKEINVLKRKVKKSKIFKILKPFSFETIIFFYAYFKNKALRNNLFYFLDKLSQLKLKIKGRDLKGLNLRPYHLYSKTLEKLTFAKIEKGLVTKKHELEESRMIFKRLKARYHKGKQG